MRVNSHVKDLCLFHFAVLDITYVGPCASGVPGDLTNTEVLHGSKQEVSVHTAVACYRY